MSIFYSCFREQKSGAFRPFSIDPVGKNDTTAWKHAFRLAPAVRFSCFFAASSNFTTFCQLNRIYLFKNMCFYPYKQAFFSKQCRIKVYFTRFVSLCQYIIFIFRHLFRFFSFSKCTRSGNRSRFIPFRIMSYLSAGFWTCRLFTARHFPKKTPSSPTAKISRNEGGIRRKGLSFWNFCAILCNIELYPSLRTARNNRNRLL